MEQIDPALPSPFGSGTETGGHGHVALLLTESLIHMLVENRALSNGDAIKVIEIAAEVRAEQTEAAYGPKARLTESLRLLNDMRRSFEANSC